MPGSSAARESNRRWPSVWPSGTDFSAARYMIMKNGDQPAQEMPREFVVMGRKMATSMFETRSGSSVANQPGLKAVHIENPEARPGGWEGLNVYDIRGETRVFVLVMPGKKDPRGR